MQHVTQFPAYEFKQQHDAGDLQSAGSRTGTAAHKHQQEQNGTGQIRPQVEVCRREAGGGQDRRHLKGGQLQCLAHAVVQIVNIGGDQRRSHTEDAQVAPQFLTFE